MNQYRIAAFVLFSLFFSPLIWSQKTISYNLSVASPCTTLNVPKQSLLFQVYPNPSNNFIEIVSFILPLQIELLDIQGRVVLRDALKQEKTLIQTENFPKGIYFLSLKNEQVEESIKLTLH